MTNFNELFGGNTIAPAQLSYISYTTNVNLTLQWNLNASPSASVVAQKIDVFAQSSGLSVTLPPANQVSQGTDILFRNVGGNTFSVLDASGNTIAAIPSGQVWYLYLLDNTTVPGAWAVFQFGTGTSAANAATLAGAGLQAIVTQLNQNLVIVPLTGNYSPGQGDRAKVLLENGGATVFTPANPNTLTNGWFVYVINAGTGTLTWTPPGGVLVDNAATKVLNPTESAVFFSDGTNFWSLGYGRAIVSTVTGTNINVTGLVSPYSLTSAQVAAQVQDYSGILVAPLTVYMGTGVGYWFVRNNTSGAFPLTFAVNGSDAGVVVPQGNFSILRSNGSNVAIAFTASSGTVTQINGTADFTGLPITSTGTIGLSNTTVVPGTAGAAGPPAVVPIITVDQRGRVTALTSYTLGTAASATTGTAPTNVPVIGADNNLPQGLGSDTGDIKYSIATSKTGWVISNGFTIGNAASGATARANADTVNLFTLLWNNWANAQAPVLPSGRGGSAAADFAANKTIGLPDLRGTVLAGMDVMNGSASAGRLASSMSSAVPGAALSVGSTNIASTNSSGVNNINYGTLALNGGIAFGPSVTVQVTAGPDLTVDSNAATFSVTGNVVVNGNFSINVSGASAAFNIAQSTMVMNVFVKL